MRPPLSKIDVLSLSRLNTAYYTTILPSRGVVIEIKFIARDVCFLDRIYRITRIKILQISSILSKKLNPIP